LRTVLTDITSRAAIAALARPRRRRRGTATTEQAEVKQLRRQNEKLARDLARTQTALEIMGKARALGTSL
jgi:hypothetical protein